MNLWKTSALMISLMASSSPAMAKKVAKKVEQVEQIPDPACSDTGKRWRTLVVLKTTEDFQAKENEKARKELREPEVITKKPVVFVQTWRPIIEVANTDALTIVFALNGTAVKTVKGSDTIAGVPIASSKDEAGPYWYFALWSNTDAAHLPDEEWNEIHIVDKFLESKCVVYKKGAELSHKVE